MPTIDELWRAVFPAAHPQHLASDAAIRPVNWVRVLKPRVPAFDALEPGDLAILPAPALEALAAGMVEPQAVVEALAKAGGVAVLVIGPVDDDAPRDEEGSRHAATAIEQATALGLSVFTVPEGDPSALERSIIGFLVNGRAELERQASILEGSLERLALERASLGDYALAIARFLGRPVAIEGSRGETLAFRMPAPEMSSSAGDLTQLPTAMRTVLPGSPRGRREPAGTSGAVGSLVFLGPDPPSELERAVAARIITLLALELMRDRRATPSVPRGSGRAEPLPIDGPPWVVVVAARPGAQQPTEDPSLAGTRRGRSDRGARRAYEQLDTPRRLVLRQDPTHAADLRFVALAGRRDPLGLEIAHRIAEAVGGLAAVSRPFHTGTDQASAELEALDTFAVVDRLPSAERRTLERAHEPVTPGRSSGSTNQARDTDGVLVARADRLPAYRLLAEVMSVSDGLHQARLLLAPLLAGSQARSRRRLETLRVVLDHAGISEAAHALGVHRNTLAYRRQQIEAATGWRLDDPGLRFALSVAVRIVQGAQ